MSRLVALAVLAGSLAATAAPAAAAPFCGDTWFDVKCTPDGRRYCLVWESSTDTCVLDDD